LYSTQEAEIADRVSGSRFLESNTIEVKNTGQQSGILQDPQEIYFVAWGSLHVKPSHALFAAVLLSCNIRERRADFCSLKGKKFKISVAKAAHTKISEFTFIQNPCFSYKIGINLSTVAPIGYHCTVDLDLFLCVNIIPLWT